jgi:two-component system chemotaxis sensor kinase CheA
MEEETVDELIAKLAKFLPGHESLETSSDIEVISDSESEDGSEKLWHISIDLHDDFYTSGMDVISIISFLEDIGEIKTIVVITEKIPLLEEYNPISAYMKFHIQLLTTSGYEDIEEVFEFILDDLELDIFKVDDTKSLKKFVEKEKDKEKFQEFLIKNKLFTQEHIDLLNPVEIKPNMVVPAPKINDKKEKELAPKQEQKSFSLRVDSSKVDHLINQISEMVIANAKIAERADRLEDTELSESTTILSDMLEQVRSSVMNIRMVQVGDSFAKYRRIVGDVAKKIGKNVNFVINGGETELDKMVVEKISDPLMHMLRNSVDHGIELAEDRIKAGKPAIGNVTLSAYPDAGTIVIEITDDGKGLDKERILAKAISNGIVKENHNLSDKEIYNLIFAAGLSTADTVSDISGRGVGMDVVKRNIEDLRGTVEINSEAGNGSVFTIRLPLTLAIIDGFLIQSGQTKYIIPLEMIQECIELSKSYKEQMKGNAFINLRDSILPLLNIREYLKEEKSQSERENIVVVRYGDYKMGLQVDELYGEFQTVIKPLGEMFVNVPGISGGTILGSGEIALIFDIPKLMEHKIRAI